MTSEGKTGAKALDPASSEPFLPDNAVNDNAADNYDFALVADSTHIKFSSGQAGGNTHTFTNRVIPAAAAVANAAVGIGGDVYEGTLATADDVDRSVRDKSAFVHSAFRGNFAEVDERFGSRDREDGVAALAGTIFSSKDEIGRKPRMVAPSEIEVEKESNSSDYQYQRMKRRGKVSGARRLRSLRENERIKRTLVIYSGPTSIDHHAGKNGMYLDNLDYFLEHGVTCRDGVRSSSSNGNFRGGGNDHDGHSRAASVREPSIPTRKKRGTAPSIPQGHPPQQQRKEPVEFDDAINYVTTIKKRFAAHPETYQKFLEILHTYKETQRGTKEVLDEVSVLFADNTDLLQGFTHFLPDNVQSQAKAQLDEVAKVAGARALLLLQKQQQHGNLLRGGRASGTSGLGRTVEEQMTAKKIEMKMKMKGRGRKLKEAELTKKIHAEEVVVDYIVVVTQDVADAYLTPNGKIARKQQQCQQQQDDADDITTTRGKKEKDSKTQPPLIRVVVREDRCYDMESIRIVVEDESINVADTYDNIVFVNCGLVGPKFGPGSPQLVPTYSEHTSVEGERTMAPYSHWTQIYTSRLTPKMAMVGQSLNTHYVLEYMPHVQSFLFAIDTQVALPVLLESGSIYDCGLTQEELGRDDSKRMELILKYEVGMSTALLKRGYEISSAFFDRYNGPGHSVVIDNWNGTYGRELFPQLSDSWYEDGIRNITREMLRNGLVDKKWWTRRDNDAGDGKNKNSRGVEKEEDTFEYHKYDILPWDYFVFFKVSRLVPQDIQDIMHYDTSTLQRSDVATVPNDPRKSHSEYWRLQMNVTTWDYRREQFIGSFTGGIYVIIAFLALCSAMHWKMLAMYRERKIKRSLKTL